MQHDESAFLAAVLCNVSTSRLSGAKTGEQIQRPAAARQHVPYTQRALLPALKF